MQLPISLIQLMVAVSLGSADMMRQVRATGKCTAPFTDCVHIESVPIPKPTSGTALIRVKASSVNPSDVDTVEAGGCTNGCGADVAGTVISCPECTRLKPGDKVWTMAFSGGAYSDYVLGSEATTGVAPSSLSLEASGTIPEVGLTSLFSLKRTGSGSRPGSQLLPGSPWTNRSNLTIVPLPASAP